MRSYRIAVVALLLSVAAASPSGAWFRGRFGYRGGGPTIGIGVGAPWWPYYYGGYPYDPYYAGPYDDSYYAPSAYSASPAQNSDDESTVKDNPAGDRERLNFEYQDGDISKEEYDAAIRNVGQPPLPRPQKSAGSQWSPSAKRDLTPISDLLLELHTLLDQKLKDGFITKAQADAEKASLDRLEQQARADAAAQAGQLTADQENAYTERLHRAYYAINHDLVTR